MRMLLRYAFLLLAPLALLGLTVCGGAQKDNGMDNIPWTIDQFADVRIMRYEIPEWDSLSLRQKELLYYLGQAALCGRDILWDQNYRYNLAIRHILEGIYKGYQGERSGEKWEAFVVYLKRLWFSNGIHHHYGETKIEPGFDAEYFMTLVANTPAEQLPEGFGDQEELLSFALPILFDPLVARKRVNKAEGEDLLATSSTNLYYNVTEGEAEAFYEELAQDVNNPKLSYGMNSQLVKENGEIFEHTWRVGGMYTEALEQIVRWLEKAQGVAETPEQEAAIAHLISFYRTGRLEDFNAHCLAWVQDTSALVDFVNGFIEDYGDPLGRKCTWEGYANFKDMEATKRAEVLSQHAQWFEDNSPTDKAYKKANVKGVTAKVVNAVQLGGDVYPSSPIGINLPNADWIRAEHGSKSVTLENITHAYEKASQGNGFLEEFAASPEEIARHKEFGTLAGSLHTDLHECLGHGSGQLAPGVSNKALKSYASTLEEARADLFALYYIRDPKLVELGILPDSGQYSEAEYDGFIRNGLMTQMVRIEKGASIEEDHMRNRALIARWCYEKGKKDNIISMEKREGKTYVQIHDYDGLRSLFGGLLREVQRIKSEGDYAAGKALVEGYGVRIDPALHEEVLTRYAALNLAPYGGFVNPVLEPVMEGDSMVDVRVRYVDDYAAQMMEYSQKYGFLPYSIK
ncbi:MAG: dihydrofolate reductase [Bacteroidetes bacterium]|nr:MAG: dihydrofolate reductase [Bacteroidota bacterium]